MTPGWESALSQLRQFYPPDLSPQYLKALVVPLLETLQIAAAATFLVIVFGLLLSLYVGARLPGARLLYALMTCVRAVPDLTLAIFCVIMFGLGKAAGMVALTIFYTAATGKVFADLFASADPGPVEALQSTGGGRVAVALVGLLPLRLNDLLTYGAYQLESVVRAATIVGAVGAGGLGTELYGAIINYEYPRAGTLILILVMVVAVVDRLAWLVRRYPKFLLVLAVVGVASVLMNRPHMVPLAYAIGRFRSMLPPQAPDHLERVPGLVGETLLMAFGGTLLATILAVPLGVAAARNLSPVFVYFPARRFLEFLRSVPEVAWGLVLMGVAGLGPKIGILALGLHSAGSLGKLFAESLENVPPEPVLAMTATGGSRIAITSFAHLPLAFAPMVVHSLFRLEWNMRAAAVVGMISAGGIGQALFNAQQLFHYREMVWYLIVTWALVMLTDAINTRVRKHWRVSEVIVR
jgi:phosphonate transport system permease protein